MRSFHLTGVLIASLALATAAAAGPAQVRGVPSFDRDSRTLYVNGTPYVLPAGKSTAGLSGADKVTVTWVQEGDRRVVETYTADREE